MAIYSMGRRRVIVLLMLTSILLITLDLRGNTVDRPRPRAAFAVAAVAVRHRRRRTVSRPIVNAWDGITNYDDLQRENEALREQIDRQHGARDRGARRRSSSTRSCCS